jgi:magnesium chelatase subunit I
MTRPSTLGELKTSGYRSRSVKDELRANVIARIRAGGKLFPRIIGFEATVEPQIVNALLSRHDFILLGLRGQAKTRLLRSLSQFLDEWIPAIAGCPLNSDPLQPLTHLARTLIAERGDQTPIAWIHRDQRYQEKLATPDVTIADLIGDIDPIKAVTLKLDYSDERVIHYGIIPRTHRGIFAINELPDLQPRIQVGLLNILEERDFQIRGFPVRMPLDIAMVFSANPEDYTNRGNIITPLRDRINSQIVTHYPATRELGMSITAQESWTARDSEIEVDIPPFMRELVEEVAIQARKSEYVDQNSGVSARLPIALIENLVSNAERRGLKTGEPRVVTRVCDLQHAVSAVSGKVELVLEGEQEGALNVARALLGRGVKSMFSQRLPSAFKPRRARGAGAGPRAGSASPRGEFGERGAETARGAEPGAPEAETLAASEYRVVLDWFASGNHVQVSDDMPQAEYARSLSGVKGLATLAGKYLHPANPDECAVAMELVLEGLHQHSMLSRERGDDATTSYRDMLKSMLSGLEGD